MIESAEFVVPNVHYQELFVDESLQLKQLDLSQAERLFELTELSVKNMNTLFNEMTKVVHRHET